MTSAAAVAQRKKDWPIELNTALVLFLVALPLNLGVAIASGVPAEFGVISGTIGSIVTGALSGCALQVSGPDAGLGVLVLDIVKSFGLRNLGPIVFVAGLIQLAIGLMRCGKWFRALSPSVVNGMLAGMGLLIVVTQFHIMLDDTPKGTGLMNLLLIPAAVFKGVFPADGSSHHLAAALGLVTIAVAICWKSFSRGILSFVPAALPAILTAVGISYFLRLPVQYMDIPSSMLASVQLTNANSIWSAITNQQMLLASATLAFVASAQSLITTNAIDRMVKDRTNYDRELLGQGIGNLLCGLLGVLPIAGVLVRSVANIQLGAKTRFANIAHGTFMVAVVALVPTVLKVIPSSSLAAVLVVLGCRMVADIIRRVSSYQKRDLAIFYATIAAILCTNLFTGVIIGFSLTALELLVISLFHLRESHGGVILLSKQKDARSIVYEEIPEIVKSTYVAGAIMAHREGGTMPCNNVITLKHDRPSRILVPIKDETYADAALTVLTQTAGAGCEVLLLAVVPSPFEEGIPFSGIEAHILINEYEEQIERTQKLLDDTAARLRRLLPNVATNTRVEVGTVCESIAKVAKDWNCTTTLLVSRRPASFWDRLVPGICQRILKESDRSVNIVKMPHQPESKLGTRPA